MRRPSTSTSVSGGEKLNAFSISSASRWEISETTVPLRKAASTRRSFTRR
ncbi:hypothetical protein O1L55_14225 [Streptomyces albulus]|nr:hypothetical protein [Streptomyces noursei]